MKNFRLILAAFALWIASPMPSGAEKIPATRTTPPLSTESHSARQALSKHTWVRAFAGYDHAYLGDVVDGLRGYVVPDGINTLKTSRSGLSTGLEFGLTPGCNNAFSLRLENTHYQDMSVDCIIDGLKVVHKIISPGWMAATLNVQRFIFNRRRTRSYISVGGGYYRTSVHMESGITESTTESGDFAGDNFGSTAGLGQVLTFGRSFGIEIAARRRWLTFKKLTASSIMCESGVKTSEHAPYVLGISTISINNKTYKLIGIWADELLQQYSSDSWYAKFDFSGFQADISFNVYF